MSDRTRREAASTDQPHPARHPQPPQHLPAPRPLPAPRNGTWPDARTAEVLLSGAGSCTPPTAPADRLVRLLAAARDGHAALDPAREAAALAAFRTAAAGRARRAGRGGTRSRSGPLAALRTVFAARRPRMMAAAVVSALALGGVVVGMAAAARSFMPGEGAGTGPGGPRPPAAVSPGDAGTAAPWTAGPVIRGAGPVAPPVRSGADERRYGAGQHGSCGGDHRDHHGDGRGGEYDRGNGDGRRDSDGYGDGHEPGGADAYGYGHAYSTGNDPWTGQFAPSGNRAGRNGASDAGSGGAGTTATPDRAGRAGRAAKAERWRGGGPHHTRHGRRPPSRAPGR